MEIFIEFDLIFSVIDLINHLQWDQTLPFDWFYVHGIDTLAWKVVITFFLIFCIKKQTDNEI